MKMHRCSTIVVYAIIILPLLTGCESEQQRFDRDRAKRQKEVIDQSEELSRRYLREDSRRARECLLKDADLLEGATILEPIGRAQLLSLTYLRLSVLERRHGNDADAEANLIKARYWLLTKGELTRMDTKKVLEQLGALGTERIAKDIEEFDKKHNGGEDPQYLKGLRDGKEPALGDRSLK